MTIVILGVQRPDQNFLAPDGVTLVGPFQSWGAFNGTQLTLGVTVPIAQCNVTVENPGTAMPQANCVLELLQVYMGQAVVAIPTHQPFDGKAIRAEQS